MADPAKGEPTKAEVFAYLDKRPDAIAADACDYFARKGRKIDSMTVRKWMYQRRQSMLTPEERRAARKDQDERRAAKKVDAVNNDNELGGKGTTHAATTRASRAPGNAPPPAPKPMVRTAANLTEPARVKLRRAVDQQLDFLSDPDTVPLQKDRADAARALTSLLLGCPDILTFEDRTSGKDRTVGENAEAAQLAAVFDVQAGS